MNSSLEIIDENEIPLIPEETKDNPINNSVMESLGLKDWKPPGEKRNKDNYEFFIFNKENKEQVHNGTDRKLLEDIKDSYDPAKFWIIETVNKKVINKEEKFVKKYEQLIHKTLEKRTHDPAMAELCYQLMAGLQLYKEKKENQK